MSGPARALTAMAAIDRHTPIVQFPEFGYFETQIDGTEPYVRTHHADVSCAPIDLLPLNARIERCVTTDHVVAVLARLADATVHIQSWARSTYIQVSAPSHERADQLGDAIRGKLPEPASNTIPVRTWHWNSNRPPSHADRNIEAPHWHDIEVNYPPSARTEIERLMTLVSPAGTGKLVLWHGPPGTGKTTALRALMRSWSDWCQTQYIADPERFFADPAYIAEVLTTTHHGGTGPTLTHAGEAASIWRLVVMLRQVVDAVDG